MFEQATKLKLRFTTKVGVITTEDLWDLPLESRNGVDLDNVARTVANKIKESGTESFVSKTAVNSRDALKLKIVKRVIEVKLKQLETNEQKVVNDSKRQVLLDALNKKQLDEIGNKSVEELQKELNDLG